LADRARWAQDKEALLGHPVASPIWGFVIEELIVTAGEHTEASQKTAHRSIAERGLLSRRDLEHRRAFEVEGAFEEQR
jgi:hypothetical protein